MPGLHSQRVPRPARPQRLTRRQVQHAPMVSSPAERSAGHSAHSRWTPPLGHTPVGGSRRSRSSWAGEGSPQWVWGDPLVAHNGRCRAFLKRAQPPCLCGRSASWVSDTDYIDFGGLARHCLSTHFLACCLATATRQADSRVALTDLGYKRQFGGPDKGPPPTSTPVGQPLGN